MTTNDSVVVSSRVRLARNFKGIPFPQRLNDRDAVRLIINKAENAATFPHDTLLMSEVNNIERLSLVERHLISPDLIKHVNTGALILSKDESISVMLNEEDHVRAQCIKPGLNLLDCYRIIDGYDNALSKEMPVAYDSDFGYLTACLTNVGTGMRASAMLFFARNVLHRNHRQVCEIRR
jgi:Arginine kinase